MTESDLPVAGRRPFGARLAETITRLGGLCVGIDPHPALIEQWGFVDNAASLERFGLTVVEAAAGRVGIVKPQVALFERFGSSGIAALERVIAAARTAGLLVIADAKRGDIGSTNAGYASAWLAAEAPLASDALTISPYLGVDALTPLVDLARTEGAGLFVLAATSNPEAEALQSATVIAEERTVAESVADAVAGWNATDVAAAAELGSFGIVFGATHAPVSRGLDIRETPTTLPLLVPGFGAQGAQLSQLDTLFPGARHRVVANVSRSVLRGGSEGLADRIAEAVGELQA
ncbi:orotidine-5'-phosphate decarboxylase [Pseudoclavibacter sp. CFCC 11306]|uniref:orotidine-5'-phosphate decarboxylase n=1 Tax=Pseudoclavibacter sp. CFCC 11306 TaxID=1564493 RepID=UPI001CE40983|nr:orotidine-5'-phosphate decarboxylase [Pseudoclavibacter sp. CFCC 11306]